MKTFRADALRGIVPALLAGFLAGCGDDPPTRPVRPIVPYPALSTPQNVLMKLQMAYVRRDSVEYATVYDSSYVGESSDMYDPPGMQTLQFTFVEEVAHVAALRRNTFVSNVVCDFGPLASWARLPSSDPSHPDWAEIQLANIRIEITEGTNTHQISSSDGDFMEFAFAPSAPESSSPTDTLWRVVRWREIRSSYP